MSNFHNIADNNKKIIESDLNPKLIVLDLDFTLWPFDCNKYIQPPFTFDGFNTRDRFGQLANPYSDVPYILKVLIELKIPVAIASRNPSSDICKSLLQTIKIPDTSLTLWDAIPCENLFHAYSSGSYGRGYGKRNHFSHIHDFCKINFSDILFFDDNLENILVAQQSNVTSVHVSQTYGLNWEAFMDGLAGWRSRKSMLKIANTLTVQNTNDTNDTKEIKVNPLIMGTA